MGTGGMCKIIVFLQVPVVPIEEDTARMDIKPRGINYVNKIVIEFLQRKNAPSFTASKIVLKICRKPGVYFVHGYCNYVI